ncbi:MAG: hypothetical protein A3H98_11940 [Bacteroidetes bacterium RIFCSPLOWO2_02_FULL_36_8]|nr:MAG: hypothetical protein A3H98_11940 [Bacteroidetes bacterium RIFCSPLOWO2_02_FULL_36_8]OFY69574.1 MAG: hypothetical protein A3G23_11090 [Bacteroidetes bacterium RIFCSPLOWO2_12_FULL_37_12]
MKEVIINRSQVKKVRENSHERIDRKDRVWLDLQDVLRKIESFFPERLPGDKKKESFYSELYTMLNAGVDLKTTLEMIIQNQKNSNDKKMCNEILQDIITGRSLSQAFLRSQKFTFYEVNSIKIAEESGKLIPVLNQLLEYYTKRIALRRQFYSAISYPLIVICTAAGSVIFMLRYIVPMFVDVFNRSKVELPYLTKLIINISDVFSNYLLYIIFLMLAGGVTILSQKKKRWFRQFSSLLVLKIPLIGILVKKIYIARFCQAMKLLLGSKVPLVTALDLAKSMMTYYPITSTLKPISKDIITGKPLHKAMSAFDIYELRLISIVKIGEEVNQLDTFFGKIAKQYSDEADYQIGIINTLLEPLLIIFLGISVGIILVAMYLPLFKLSSQFF